MAATSRDVDFYMVQLLEQTDRHADMIEMMKRVISMGPVLNAEERNFLSISYKNIVKAKRHSIHYLTSLLDRDETQSSPGRVAQVTAFRAEAVQVLDRYCKELISIIDEKLLPATDDPAARLFYCQLRGDYCRYICEHKDGPGRESWSSAAIKSYGEALDIARAEFPAWEPAYLGLILNFSVHLYEIVGQKKEAVGLAESAIAESGAAAAKGGAGSPVEAENILKLLRENVQAWGEAQQCA